MTPAQPDRPADAGGAVDEGLEAGPGDDWRAVDDDDQRIVWRPDGFHWLALDGRQWFGPFETRALAVADRDAADETAIAPQAALLEVERELGMAGWIDPETGEPAEGPCPPHLDAE